MSLIDLHMHSISSNDGEFTAKELMQKCRDKNMRLVAITDHDSVDNVAEGHYWAHQFGIQYIDGIELSTKMPDGTELHILGYGIDITDPFYRERINQVKQACIDSNKARIDTIRALGFKFDENECYKEINNNVVTQERIGTVILADPRNDDDPRLKEYRPGGSKSANPGFEFYREFCSQGKAAYVEIDNNMPLSEAAERIHASGGIMVLAHPYHNIKDSKEKLAEIISYGLDGIEAYSSYHNAEQTEYYVNKAKEHNLLVTVGSDFHGMCKPAIEIGSTECDELAVYNGLRKKLFKQR